MININDKVKIYRVITWNYIMFFKESLAMTEMLHILRIIINFYLILLRGE